ncbi:hypothetical protein J6590_044160 [Homalodisca vitripennis]|nr:hypothetical protein J6590_044160 [Homalodisca vitripennis]
MTCWALMRRSAGASPVILSPDRLLRSQRPPRLSPISHLNPLEHRHVKCGMAGARQRPVTGCQNRTADYV